METLILRKMGMDGYNSAEELSQLFSTNEIEKFLLTAITAEKNTDEFFLSFYVLNGRLYSREMMANWRLEIWQDILRDLKIRIDTLKVLDIIDYIHGP